MTAIPVIDISDFRTGGAGAQAAVDALATAARDTGFFLVTGHGVDADATARLYATARRFFDLPAEARAAQASAAAVAGGLSYAPLAQEALAATRGEPTPGDIKHSLNYGPRLDGAPWPAAPEGQRAAFEAYFAEMERLSAVLRAMFCAAIGLPRDYFEPAFTHHVAALRVIDYPEQETAPLPGQLRAGAHTDYGFLTILRSEASPGGLQVQTLAGAWIDVPTVAGAFVINIADAFMRWSNDRWRSTPHRVVNPPARTRGARRHSIAFFLKPTADAEIACLPPFAQEGARRHPPADRERRRRGAARRLLQRAGAATRPERRPGARRSRATRYRGCRCRNGLHARHRL